MRRLGSCCVVHMADVVIAPAMPHQEETMAIDATLWVPSDVYVNLMPPVPTKVLVPVPVAAFLTNQGGAAERCLRPRPAMSTPGRCATRKAGSCRPRSRRDTSKSS